MLPEYVQRRRVSILVRRWLLAFVPLLFFGCAATSTIQTRREEKTAAYSNLSPEERQLVDQGQIKVGMSADSVYIAWGQPAEVLESEDQFGHITTWRYFGSWMQESRYWAYRETSRGGTDIFLERYLVSDFQPRDYVRSEINFKDGRVISWRTLPRPAY